MPGAFLEDEYDVAGELPLTGAALCGPANGPEKGLVPVLIPWGKLYIVIEEETN